MKTFHRKMWEAKEKGYISEEVWKKLCNQPLEAFRGGLHRDFSEYLYSSTLLDGFTWRRTNEDFFYWDDIYESLENMDV